MIQCMAHLKLTQHCKSTVLCKSLYFSENLKGRREERKGEEKGGRQ